MAAAGRGPVPAAASTAASAALAARPAERPLVAVHGPAAASARSAGRLPCSAQPGCAIVCEMLHTVAFRMQGGCAGGGGGRRTAEYPGPDLLAARNASPNSPSPSHSGAWRLET